MNRWCNLSISPNPLSTFLVIQKKQHNASRVHCDYRYEPKSNWPANQFADNWFYMQRFDTNMQPVTSGSILGIPSPKQWWVGDGPIEPRVLTTADGKLVVSFNIAMGFEKNSYMDYTVWIDMNKNLPIIPFIEGGKYIIILIAI